MKLTEKRQRVLQILSSHKDECPLTGPEIGELRFRHRGGKHGLREWATPALKALMRGGLVQPLGVSMSNARCWAITDAGRAALASEDGGGRDESGQR